jgi:Tfp pilus assembly protein FimV
MRESAVKDEACPVCGAELAERLRHDAVTCARRVERRAALRVMKAEIEERERDLAEAVARYRASPERAEEAREYAEAYEAEHGPISQAARDEAAAALGLVGPEG